MLAINTQHSPLSVTPLKLMLGKIAIVLSPRFYVFGPYYYFLILSFSTDLRTVSVEFCLTLEDSHPLLQIKVSDKIRILCFVNEPKDKVIL
jgi:hypothetical protein